MLIDADDLIASAEQSLGLVDAVDAGLRERVHRFVDAVNTAGDRAPDAVRAARTQVTDVLTKRLRMWADRRRCPAIADERIDRPIFVVGFPRAGTTLLHALLAEAPGHRAPMLWEVRNPSAPPGLAEPDDLRIALGDLDAREWCEHVPGILTAHPYFDKGAFTPVEDEELMGLDFHNAYPTWYSKVHLQLAGVGSADPLASYQFHREFLQHLQWGRPGERWALKGTAHQFCLEALWSVYPDALCVWPHRAPSETFGSLLELLTMVNEAQSGPVDRPAVAEATLSGLRAGLDHVLAGETVDDERVVHVRYPDLVSDPIGAVRRICQREETAWSEGAETVLAAWLADPANASNRHGKFTYSLDVFGLSVDEVERRFSDYTDRFLR